MSQPTPRAGTPVVLDHAGIAQRIPHAGAMNLLQSLLAWDEHGLRCSISGHADPGHPLRTEQGLPACTAIEYAAQAMALHAALKAEAGGGAAAPTPGFLASAREVVQHVPRLDDASGPLVVQATRLAGDTTQAAYRFELADAAGRVLVQGRATVVLNTPLPTP